ncbi:unnamed protein product, partial [Tilletia laevis]
QSSRRRRAGAGGRAQTTWAAFVKDLQHASSNIDKHIVLFPLDVDPTNVKSGSSLPPSLPPVKSLALLEEPAATSVDDINTIVDVERESAEQEAGLAVEDLPIGKSTIASMLMLRMMTLFEAIGDMPAPFHCLAFGHVAVSYARATLLGHSGPSPVPTLSFGPTPPGSRVASFSSACHPSYVRWGQADIDSLPELVEWAISQVQDAEAGKGKGEGQQGVGKGALEGQLDQQG